MLQMAMGTAFYAKARRAQRTHLRPVARRGGLIENEFRCSNETKPRHNNLVTSGGNGSLLRDCVAHVLRVGGAAPPAASRCCARASLRAPSRGDPPRRAIRARNPLRPIVW